MKALSFFIILFFSLQHCEAQKAVVANLKMNVVEVGVVNPLEILLEGYKCTEFDVTTSNGLISKSDSNCTYNYTPERQGLSKIIISTKEGKVISTIFFRAKFIQEPVISLCGRGSGMLYIDDLLRCTQLDAIVKGFDWDSGFRIQKYCVSIIRNCDSVFTKKDILGSSFSENLKQEFKNIGHGSKLIFYGITALGRDKRTIELSPLEFTITKK